MLPGLVDTFGAQPRATLDTLLAQVPDSLLTDLLNANGGTVHVATLLGTLGLNPDVAERMTAEAGFTRLTCHDFDDPVNLYYEVRP